MAVDSLDALSLNSSDIIDEIFKKAWRGVLKKTNLKIIMIKLLQIGCAFTIPYLLDELTNGLKTSDSQVAMNVKWFGVDLSRQAINWIYTLILILTMITAIFLETQFAWQINKLRCRGKVVFQYLIYSKLIHGKTIKNKSNKDQEQANINNLISADTDSFLNIFYNFHETWSSLISATLISIVLFFKVIVVSKYISKSYEDERSTPNWIRSDNVSILDLFKDYQ